MLSTTAAATARNHPAAQNTNRNSFISVTSTTTYASSLSHRSDYSDSSDDPIPDHHIPHPTAPAMATATMMPEDPQAYRTPPRKPRSQSHLDSRVRPRTDENTRSVERAGHVRDMIDRLNPDSSTPSRPRPAGGESLDPSRITQRPSQAQLRTKASSSHLSTGSAPSRRPSPSSAPKERPLPPVSRKPASDQAVQKPTRPPNIQVTSEPMISKANPPNVRTGTSIIAKPRLSEMDARLRPPATRTAPVSPARSEITLADEWDAELKKNAKMHPAPAITEQRSENPVMKWERMGMWEYGRQDGREAEDRVRREHARPVAYPPSLPRLPIRAAATGVTSIHIGVRPRIHPSRADDTFARNQPDETLPEPLFSPDPSPQVLTPDGGPETPMRSSEQYQRAQKEYEDWVARKTEREGGIGVVSNDDDYGSGSREWVPRQREQARFGSFYGQGEAYPASLAKGGHAGQVKGQEDMKQIGWQGYGGSEPYVVQPDAQQQMQMGQGMGMGMGVDGQDPYAGYGYWDPAAYWWAAQMGMAQMGMAGLDLKGQPVYQGPSPMTSDESSASSGASEEDKAAKVHFAPSPDKTKPRRRPSMLGLNVAPKQQGKISRDQSQDQIVNQDAMQEGYPGMGVDM